MQRLLSAWPAKLLLLLFLGAIFIYAVNPLSEADSFYHLRTGQLIWETHSVPAADVFSYTAPGAAWITHEWLAELIFYATYRLGGLWLLVFLVAALAALTYYLIFRMAVERGASPILAPLFLFLFGYLTLELWVPRPQAWSYLLFVGLLFLLERYRRTGELKNLFWIAPLLCLWANMNASFLLGLAVIGLYALFSILAIKFPHLSPGKTSLKHLLFLLLACTLLALINPNGYRVFLYPLYVQPAVSALRIWEWQPITQYLARPQTKIFLSFMFLADAFVIWWFGLRKVSRDWLLVALVLAISCMPFISIRHVGFWPLAAIYPLIVGASTLLDGALRKFNNRLLAAFLALIAILFMGGRIYSFPPSPVDAATLPVQAVDFVQENGLRGPVFNLYNEGGYLIWRLYPEQKVFIDGRSEVYPLTVIRELFTVATASAGWEDLVDAKYHINYFLLPYRLSENVFRGILALQKAGWPLVYWDNSYIIFVRPSPENMDIIDKYALRHISPLRDPQDIPPDEAEAAAQEIKSLLDREPNAEVIQDYARSFLGAQALRAGKKQ